MKKGIYSRKDMVEKFAKDNKDNPCKPLSTCAFWRFYFKKHGWRWNEIWKNLGVFGEQEY